VKRLLDGPQQSQEKLQAWYDEMILRCRTRYERDQGSAG
jgi:hypothetical protein